MWDDEVIDGCSFATMVTNENKLFYHDNWRIEFGLNPIVKRYVSSDYRSIDF
jgi:hypothetical protein